MTNEELALIVAVWTLILIVIIAVTYPRSSTPNEEKFYEVLKPYRKIYSQKKKKENK